MKYQSIYIDTLRATRVTAGGVLLDGPTDTVVTKDLTQVAYSVETESGQRKLQRTGDGSVCFILETDDKIIGSGIVVDLCQDDAALMELTAGMVLNMDGDDIVGWQLPRFDAPQDQRVAIETWSWAWDGAERKTTEAGVPLWVKRCWPSVKFAPSGNPTMNEELLIQQLTGKSRQNAQFGTGPDGNWAPVVGPYSEEVTEVPPPAPTDGYIGEPVPPE